jgi:hypothetical protein
MSFSLSREIELERIVSLQEAARLRDVSIDTLRRRHRDQIIQISPRRQGMRLRDALMLTNEAQPFKPPLRG